MAYPIPQGGHSEWPWKLVVSEFAAAYNTGTRSWSTVRYGISARPGTWTGSRRSGGTVAASAVGRAAARVSAACTAASTSARPSRSRLEYVGFSDWPSAISSRRYRSSSSPPCVTSIVPTVVGIRPNSKHSVACLGGPCVSPGASPRLKSGVNNRWTAAEDDKEMGCERGGTVQGIKSVDGSVPRSHGWIFPVKLCVLVDFDFGVSSSISGTSCGKKWGWDV